MAYDLGVIPDMIVNWVYDFEMPGDEWGNNYQFYCPYPVYIIENLIDRKIDNLSPEQIAGFLKKKNIPERLIEPNNTIRFRIDKEMIDKVYAEIIIKRALETFMNGVKIKSIEIIKHLGEDRVLVGLDKASGDKLTEFLEGEMNQNQVISDVADYLDIWGTDLNNTKHLIGILFLLGITKLAGYNYYEADESLLQKIADNGYYGDYFGWIDDELKKNLEIRISDVTVY